MIEIREFDRMKASDETLRAMAFRCEQQGHDWRNGAGFRWKASEGGGAYPGLVVYQFCYWCGAEREP